MTRLPSKSITLMTMTVALLLPALAIAHPAYDAVHNFATGFGHPLSGVDHLLAALAVGFWAAQLGGRTVTRLPLAFMASIALGLLIGAFAWSLPGSEALVMGSVLSLTLLVALRVRTSLTLAASLVSLFGVAHGYVHAVEMTPSTPAGGYLLGILMATAALPVLGMQLARWCRSLFRVVSR